MMVAHVSPPRRPVMTLQEYARRPDVRIEDLISVDPQARDSCDDGQCCRMRRQDICKLCALSNAAQVGVADDVIAVPIRYVFPIATLQHVLNLGSMLVQGGKLHQSAIEVTQDEINTYVIYELNRCKKSLLRKRGQCAQP